ncbi:MAG TPA: O-antigen ligase family protein, partial [Lysobacter sp.]|nr:O-antigen ligase family protein [Lysobacter sp.]
MPNSADDMSRDSALARGWRWAPAWVLAFVALWPAPGYAEGVMVLGALAAIVRL